MQQRQRQLVHAHVVVLPERSRFLQRPGVAFGTRDFHFLELDGAVAIGAVRQSEALALPLAGLLQDVLPCDACIAAVVESDAWNPVADGFPHIGNQPPVERDAGEQREVGLGDAEGEIRAVGFAPRRDLAPLDPDHAGYGAAVVYRSSQPVPRRWILQVDAPVVVDLAGPGGFVRLRELDRTGKGKRIHDLVSQGITPIVAALRLRGARR